MELRFSGRFLSFLNIYLSFYDKGCFAGQLHPSLSQNSDPDVTASLGALTSWESKKNITGKNNLALMIQPA